MLLYEMRQLIKWSTRQIFAKRKKKKEKLEEKKKSAILLAIE